MPSMAAVVQETDFTLDSGLKIRTFRKDPAKFFLEIEKWMSAIKVGSIERMAITGDGAGYLTLVIAYRETEAVMKERMVQYDTLALLADLAESVESIADKMLEDRIAKEDKTLANGSSSDSGAPVLAD